MNQMWNGNHYWLPTLEFLVSSTTLMDAECLLVSHFSRTRWTKTPNLKYMLCYKISVSECCSMFSLLYILIILTLLLRISFFSLFYLQEKSNQNKTFFVTKKLTMAHEYHFWDIKWDLQQTCKPRFVNLGDNSYLSFLLLIITLHFTERKYW